MSRQQSFTRWEAYLGNIADDATREALAGLERQLRTWWQLLEYGPIPGGYIPITFSLDGDGAALPVANTVLAQVVPMPLEAVALTGWTEVSSPNFVRVRIVNEPGTTVINNVDMDDAGTIKNAAGDFSTKTIPAGRVRLDIVANASSAELLCVTLWCKRAGRIEP